MNIRLTDKHKIKVSASDDIYEVMRHILLRDNKVDREKEHFWLICLANNNLISNIELVSLGSVDATVVKPMNVFRVAVMKGAVKVILCHNHPGGNLTPSDADKDLTDRLMQVGRILNIEVIDHLIITTKTYMSFADTELLDKITKSTKWVPNYELASEIRKEEAQIRKQAVKEAKEKSMIKAARGMKRKGISVDDISEITGLSKEEIEKLRV
jgi:DNA repair protein RadC